MNKNELWDIVVLKLKCILQPFGVNRKINLYAFFFIGGLLLSMTARAAVFPVTNTNDAGVGSFRQAIIDLNAAGAGPHRIIFNVYGQITISSSLPQITKSDVTIDGQNRITLNANLTASWFFWLNADNVTIRNFTVQNTVAGCILIEGNRSNNTVSNIVASSTTNNIDQVVYVRGNSTNLTLRNITCRTGIEVCYDNLYGRGIYFAGGTHTNVVLDSIHLATANNTTGCEAIVFRDALVDGLTFTNSDISGFVNGLVLHSTGGAVETANNVTIRNIDIDSLYRGDGHGIYSNFVSTNWSVTKCDIDLDNVLSTNDADYGIRFQAVATNTISLDSVTIKDGDLQSIWFNGAAQNISINHTKITDPTPGDGYSGEFIRFEGAVNTLTIKNTLLDADKLNTADDAQYGIVFIGAVTNVVLDSLTINEFDEDGIDVWTTATNFQLTNSTFTNNRDGIEFYNNAPRSNVDVLKSVFSRSTRAGMMINAANAVSDVDLAEDTVFNSAEHGIWLHGGTAAGDVMISNCVIHDNGGAGIYNADPDKVIYTNNSIYNNTSLGIDNVSGNCGYQNPGNVPTLVSSTSLGAGQYQLLINLPATVPNGYTVDIYANDPTTSASSGQYFVTSISGLNSGNNTITFTYNSGPGLTGAGFWTATLRIPANNCGTSEFSNKLSISPQGPGNVDANVKLWLRADATLTNNTSMPTTEGQVVNRWSDFSQGGAPNGATIAGTLTYKKAGINFNPTAYFNGGAVLQASGNGSAWINSANLTSFAVFNKYTNSANGSRLYVLYDNSSNGYDYTTNAESLVFARNGNNVQTHRGNAWENPAITNALGKPGLFTSVTNTAAHALYHNGTNQGATGYNKGNINAEQWFVGGGYANGWCCGTIADVAEIITFDRELTIPEIERVHSYLAIKYGLTLPGNYTASDASTTFWNAATNAGYLKHITGIGRDDSTFLYQKQSVNADTGIVTIALGDSVRTDNASNIATIAANKSFFLFGDDGASNAYTTAVAGANVSQRMARTFKVQKTNWTDKNITLKVNGAGPNNYLLISTDPGFGTISQELRLNGSGSITLNSSLLADGIYFTVGASIKGPNSVNTGIVLWLRADDKGVTGAQWNDFSGNGNGVAQSASASQPAVAQSAFNFNEGLRFDGVNDHMPLAYNAALNGNITVYAVYRQTAGSGYRSPVGSRLGSATSRGWNYYINGDRREWWTGNNASTWDVFLDGNYTAKNPEMAGMAASVGTGNATKYLYINGALALSATNRTYLSNTTNQFSVGSNGDPSAFWNGDIAETVVYSRVLDATDRQKVESYLAVKYGITLNNGAADYLGSDGSVYWSTAANNGYNRHITGIGRDSITALYQKQSRSVDTGYVTIALGTAIAATNAANTGAITNDKSFFVFGDNGAPAVLSAAITGLTNVNVALARAWKIQKTANWADQDITLLTDSTLPAPEYLIISTDATFGAGDMVLPVSNRSITFNTSQLQNGSYFTFGNALKGPAGVNAGIGAWWRADIGAGGAAWNDYSGNGKTQRQAVAANQPLIVSEAANFNPALDFDASNDYMTSASVFGTSGVQNSSFFSVTVPDGGGDALFAEQTSNGDYIRGYAPFSNANIYFDAPYGYRVFGPWGGVYGRPHLFEFIRKPSGVSMDAVVNNRSVASITGVLTNYFGINSPFYIGAQPGAHYNGKIAEFIVYKDNSAMTAADRLKIQSYLAIKYGITLNQTIQTSYVASDGTTYWDASANSGYAKRITGLGRDSITALYQKQSLSVDTGLVTIAAGNAIAASNNASAAIIPNDKSFLVFGDNGGQTRYLTPVTGVAGITTRMPRIWKVDKTANWSDQNITLKLNGGDALTYLLVSSDADFGAGDAAYVFADSTVTLNSSNLPDGAYFTFATALKGPNGVVNGINFWVRADDGQSNGARWYDYSRLQNDALQPVVANQPATDARGINFNYALKFDGAGDFLDINTTRIHPDSATILAVASGSGYNAYRELVGGGTVGSAVGMEFRITNAARLELGESAGGYTPITGLRTYIQDRPYVFGATQNNLANGIKLYHNFTLDNQGTLNISPASTNLVSLGARTISSRAFFWLGNMSEVIVYNRVLGDAELQTVHSYLSLKYGITMSGGTLNYLASDGTPYWSADASYKNRITGIGRDDSTALNTKQSLSADTGVVTIALGNDIALTNETNGNTITNNKSFLVFADNGLLASNFTAQVTSSAHNVTRRMARVWKVQKTNWADLNITLKIRPIGIDNYLLISSDPTFTTLSHELPLNADGTITLSSAFFTATDLYFTFGAPLKSPGGVPGHSLWVRADIGTAADDSTTIEEWVDLSALANTATQTTANNRPVYMDNSVDNVNFNPVVKFNGTSHRMILDGAKLPLGTAARTAIAVTDKAAIASRSVISWGNVNGATNGTRYSMEVGGGQRSLESSNSRYGNTGGNTMIPGITTFTSAAGTTASATQIKINGAAAANAFICCGNQLLNTTSNALAYLGDNAINSGGGLYYSGSLGETIVYDKVLTTTEQQQVESYLSVKYGITMNNGATSYLATNGVTIWDAPLNATYKNNIAGIGRDDEEALSQKQSRSVNTGTQVVIGLGSIDSTNLVNPNSFAADRSYLVWGDDNGALSFRTAVSGTAPVNYRMGRVWKVQETGTVGNVVIAIPANALANPASSYIIVSNDATFDGTDAFTKLEPVVINNKAHYATTVDVTNGQYFTFANDLKIPGGVVGNTLWLRPDFGTSSAIDNTAISEWNDFGADINNGVQANAASQPLYQNNIGNNINFNPVVAFNGSNQFMDLDITKLPMGTSARTLAAVGKPVTVAGTNNRYLLSWGQSVTSQGSALGTYTNGAGVFVGYSDDLVTAVNFWQPNRTNVLVNVFNGAGGSAAMYSKGVQVAGPVNKNWNTTGTVARIGNSSFAATQPEYWNGAAGDIIVYPFALNAGQRLKVESYLAIKYGYSIDQTTANNYLATDSSVIWDATANVAYKFGITGIGRDDLEGLNQKQSRNTDTTRMRIAIGLGRLAETNSDNAGTFSTDKSYMIWGDDNGAVSFKTPVANKPEVNYRMTRIWKVQETTTAPVGEVEIAIPYDALPNPRQSYLAISADAVFDNTDTYIPLYDITLNGKKHWAAKADLGDGQYFTIAAFIKSPGGVGATSLWIRADNGILNNTDGAPVEMWVDFGNEVNNASQTNAGIQPVFRNNATDNINYNPVVKFNGTTQYMNLDITKLPMGTNARTLIGVAKSDNIAGGRYVIAYGNSVLNQGMGLSNNGGTAYWIGYSNDISTAAGFWQQNVPNELFGTWTGSGGAANLYSKMLPVAPASNRAWNTAGTVARIGNSPWASEYWTGPVSEVIAFNRALLDAERQRVSTYLAIRHGYTIDQTVPVNYLNTNSTVIWDATANAAYKFNIAGIGRDDIEGLNQKQSKSTQAGAVVAIGLGSIETDNVANASTFLGDTAYMIWGSNSTALTTQTTDLPALFARRLTQEWKVSMSNFNNLGSPVSMEFDLTGITHGGDEVSDFTLLIDADGDGNFATGTVTEITADDYTANKLTFSNVTAFTHGSVFTIAIGPKSLRLIANVILQGAWNGTAMRTDLKTAGILPATDPYGLNTTPVVDPNASAAPVVDWIKVELRDAANPATVIESRAAFVLANGNLVDTNYTQPLVFYSAPAANYKVVIRHRNHLGIMSLNEVDFSTGTGTVDFTASITATYGSNAQKDMGSGIRAMWAGNVNGDNAVRNSAKPSDASLVANAVRTYPGNTTYAPAYTGFAGYDVHDVNLDGKVYYTALPSDYNIIGANVASHPGNTFGLSSYVITEQLP